MGTRTLVLDAQQMEQKICRMAWEIFEKNHLEKEIVIAGITWPPDPPVEIKTFFVIYWVIFLFVKFKIIPANIDVLIIDEPP